MYAREFGRTMHKRSTIELLLRGKAGGGAVGTPGGDAGAGGGHPPHRFEKFNYTNPTPTYCDVCNSLLWGLVRTGYRCQVRWRGVGMCFSQYMYVLKCTGTIMVPVPLLCTYSIKNNK
jgi:hypothetical protein